VKNTAMNAFHIPGSSVEGASTKRAQELSQQFSSSFGNQVDVVKKQALQVKVSDVVNSFSHLRKIPQDIPAMEKYVQDQVENMLKSKK
jgi:hypothetical protein